MFLPKRKAHLILTLLTFIVLILPEESFTSQTQKTGKENYKKVLAVHTSGKKSRHKEYEALLNENVKDVDNVGEEVEKNVETQLGTEIQENLDKRRVVFNEINRQEKQQDLRRFRRDLGEGGLRRNRTKELKSGKKNHKKLKLAEMEGLKGLKSKEFLSVEEWKKNNGDGKYLSGKKMARRRAVYARKVCRICIDENGGNRLKREANKRPLRANSTDYYAQRKAVMERFYARQREIAERYAKQGTSTVRSLLKYDLNSELSNDSSVVRVESNRKENVSGGIEDSGVEGRNDTFGSTEVREENYTTMKIDFKDDLKPEAGGQEGRRSSNVERDAVNYYGISLNYDNAPREGSFLLNVRNKTSRSYEERRYEEDTGDDSVSVDNSRAGDQRWGECTGRIIYQHNLLLGLKGPSNLDAVFEAIIQGPICITCVEAIRYNRTRAMVSLHSGGRGYEFVKLKLKGYENEGFSYIVKIWGIKEEDDNCENMR